MNADDTTDVVTAFLRDGGDVLLLRRSDAVGTYAGAWGGVSGYAEGEPDEQVRVEIREETGLEPDSDAVSFVRSGRPVTVTDDDLERTWRVHPYLFDCDSREIELSEEHTEARWVSPTAILESDVEFERESESESDSNDGPDEAIHETVPALWETYERVAPTVRSIAADDAHGAAYLSVRALEVLRDRAGLLVDERADGDGEDAAAGGDEPTETEAEAEVEDEEWDELAALARRLLEARPSMAVLRNRVNRAMATADESRGAAGVLESTLEGIDRALEADSDAAAEASEYADGRVLTLSRSGTVLEALRRGEPTRVFVAESRPAREGIDVAVELAADLPVTVHTDAAIAHVLAREEIDCVLVGADAVLPDGRVVNKTGTRGAAIAAARDGVPVYAVAASDKLSTRQEVNLESGSGSAIYDGDASVDVANPTFDVTPPDCVTGIVTEEGTHAPDELEERVEELRALEAWESGAAAE